MELTREFVERWYDEVWNKGNVGAIAEMRHEKSVAHGIYASTEDGVDAFIRFQSALRGAFPDMHVTVDQVLIQGDWAAVRVSMTGTHTGATLGIPPTNKSVNVTAMAMLRVVDGRTIESWNNIDMLGLLMQIRAVNPISDGALLASATGMFQAPSPAAGGELEFNSEVQRRVKMRRDL